MKTPEEILPIEDLDDNWTGIWNGNTNRRDIIEQAVLYRAMGFTSGSAVATIMFRLDLTKTQELDAPLTDKGYSLLKAMLMTISVQEIRMLRNGTMRTREFVKPTARSSTG